MKKSHLPEILACLVVLLALVLFARWWKRGSDRSACIINIRNVQQAVRGYSGMNSCRPTAEQMWKDIFTGPGRMLDTPKCPSGGTYTFHKPGNICAPPGYLFCECSHAKTLGHLPADTADW